MSLKKLFGIEKRLKGPSPLNLAFRDDILYDKRRYSGRLTYDDLINAESEIGRTIFGPIPSGHQREFFKNKENVWIWYEKWVDASGMAQDTTISYEVFPNGVYKKAMGGKYEKIDGTELTNFANAVRAYYKLVKDNLYN